MQKYKGTSIPHWFRRPIYSFGQTVCTVKGGPNSLWYEGKVPRPIRCTILVCLAGGEDDDDGYDPPYGLSVIAVTNYRNGDGLIYTDDGFLRDVQKFLKAQGMPCTRAIDYTEQGMQGDNYVSMETDSKKNLAWFKKMMKVK